MAMLSVLLIRLRQIFSSFHLNFVCLDIKPRKQHKKKGHLPTHQRPVYHSDGEGEEDENSTPTSIPGVRKYRDDGNEDFYDERME